MAGGAWLMGLVYDKRKRRERRPVVARVPTRIGGDGCG